MTPAVLIVDDEPHILQSLKRLLRPDGYEVLLADSGDDAVRILAERDVAAIICDQRMPGRCGAEVLAEAARLRPDAFRVTLTGHTDLASAQASINQGAVNCFLLKPWDDEHLRRVVRDGVRATEALRENRRLEELTRRQKEELEAINRELEDKVRERTAALQAQNVQLRELQRRMERSLRDTVAVLAGLLETHSPSLGIHSKRVATLARVVGRRLQLDETASRELEFAAYLHDIGRISPLHRPSPRVSRMAPRAVDLTIRHSDSGAAILGQVQGFENVALAVRHQYEHFDGSGYPDRLRGEDIPLAARVIAVVNTYDEAAHSTSHLTHVARDDGRRAIVKGQGTRFDPRVVALVLAYLDETEHTSTDHSEVELSPSQIQEGMVLSRDITNLDGVRLLSRGTRLTFDHIQHIRALAEINPLLTRVFVCCSRRAQDRPSARRDEPRASAPTPSSPPSAAPSAMPSPPSPGSCPFAERPRRVLIVDDSEFVRRAMARELHRLNLEHQGAADGVEALELANRQEFDVAIIDLAMPRMNGTELVRRLAGTAPNLRCVIVTAHATRDDVTQLVHAPNVAGILVKPWDTERLAAAIQKALAAPRPAEETV